MKLMKETFPNLYKGEVYVLSRDDDQVVGVTNNLNKFLYMIKDEYVALKVNIVDFKWFSSSMRGSIIADVTDADNETCSHRFNVYITVVY